MPDVADPEDHPASCEEPPEYNNTQMTLPATPAPSPLGHYCSIPGDIAWNLYRVLTDDAVRYEATTYGYYNRCLSAVFPSYRWFQVCHS